LDLLITLFGTLAQPARLSQDHCSTEYVLQGGDLRINIEQVFATASALVGKAVAAKGSLDYILIYRFIKVQYLTVTSIAPQDGDLSGPLEGQVVLEGQLTQREFAPAGDPHHYFLRAYHVNVDASAVKDASRYLNQPVIVRGHMKAEQYDSARSPQFEALEIVPQQGDRSQALAQYSVEAGDAESTQAGTIPTEQVCSFQPVPRGWVVQNVFTGTGCPGDTDNKKTIANLNDQQRGTRYTCCSLIDAPVPNGWSVIGTQTDFSRCGQGNVHLDNVLVIEKQ
jgi:hypothetical protein